MGRVVVITGGSAGVGRAMARRFGRGGDRVAVIGRDRAGVEDTAREIEAAGGEGLALALDVADAEAVRAAADEVARRWGRIDVWVNNAMATMFAPLSKMTAAEFRRVTEVTYLGYVHGTMAALTHMRPRGEGVILQIGSALAWRGIPLQSAYCGAKFAIRGFTDSLRSELIHEGLAVKLGMLQLPAVDTPQFDWARNAFDRRPQPVAPIYDPDDIAEIAWRASHAAPRELWIGYPSLKIIAGSLLAPAWLDRYLAWTGYDGQLSAEAETPGRPDNLFRPVARGHAAHGRFEGKEKPQVFAFEPAAVRTLALGAVAALGLLAGWAAARRLGD